MHDLYNIYYRAKGVRYAASLMNLPNSQFNTLPRAALFHYVPEPGGHPWVDTSLPIFAGYSRKILLQNIEEYTITEGGARRPMLNLKELTRDFKRKNARNWTLLMDDSWKLDQSPETLVVLNYGYLDIAYKYLALQMSEYYRWLNRERTVWTKIAEIAKYSERNQFIRVRVPEIIQGRTILDKYANDPVSITMVNIFGKSGAAGYSQLDMWKWLSIEHRSKSLMNLVDPDHYSKINLVLEGKSGQQAIVNLGYLNSWIKGQKNTTDLSSIMQMDKMQIQKLYLHSCMVLNSVTVEDMEKADETGIQEVASVAAPKPYMSMEPAAAADTGETPEEVTLSGDEEENTEPEPLDSGTGGHAYIAKGKSPTKIDLIKEAKLEKAKAPSLTQSLMSDLEKDMEMLDRLSLKQLQNSGMKLGAMDEEHHVPVVDTETIRAKVYKAVPPEEVLKARLDKEAEANLLTAADYRKLLATVETYRASEDPYGSKHIRVEAMVIKPEDVLISKESSAIVTSEATPDKTMAFSTLKELDRQYAKKVYKKDILKSVDAIQSAGVTIRRHEIDVTHSALGSYEHHTLELKPLDGAPSTLQFTFPKIEEDGTFMASGNKYRLRVQRTDIPIRKIAPRIVALSTYYGKTFVQTNPKVVNDSLAWLYRQINDASLVTGAYIHDVNPGDVFDNDYQAPYIFSALAKEYEQFTAGKITLHFDHRKTSDKIPPESVAGIPKNGMLWCGWTDDKLPVMVDKNNKFFKISKDGSPEPLGEIYDVLKLDTAKKPIDIAEVRIFSKYIPVGVVLGYYIGLGPLISLLGEQYRVVEGRKQKNLEKGEFALSFKNESYIFKPSNPITSMILSGFNDFEKVIKMFDREAFENKDVYLNLFMSKKMSAIYVRELDMMENSFIDPISLEILQSMGEPETFIGLLVKACQMLTTYTHPLSQDRAAMRDRGYERFAGTMYKELITAVRQFRNKNLVGRSKIDMSPYQVWNAIMKDSSLKIVEDTNPIQNLKESEVITYSGTGGRDKDTMTKPTRAYHPNDHGVTSESTVDSSGVGTIAYLSANPNVVSVRGLMAADGKKDLNPTSILSTSALISPASMNDN